MNKTIEIQVNDNYSEIGLVYKETEKSYFYHILKRKYNNGVYNIENKLIFDFYFKNKLSDDKYPKLIVNE